MAAWAGVWPAAAGPRWQPHAGRQVWGRDPSLRPPRPEPRPGLPSLGRREAEPPGPPAPSPPTHHADRETEAWGGGETRERVEPCLPCLQTPSDAAQDFPTELSSVLFCFSCGKGRFRLFKAGCSMPCQGREFAPGHTDDRNAMTPLCYRTLALTPASEPLLPAAPKGRAAG